MQRVMLKLTPKNQQIYLINLRGRIGIGRAGGRFGPFQPVGWGYRLNSRGRWQMLVGCWVVRQDRNYVLLSCRRASRGNCSGQADWIGVPTLESNYLVFLILFSKYLYSAKITSHTSFCSYLLVIKGRALFAIWIK